MKSGRFDPVVFCPGYLRGVAFHGDYAILGLSRPRDNKTFQGLVLDERLAKEKVEARSGLYVVDLKSGGIPHFLHAEGFIAELYDVVVLPSVKRPSMIGFQNDQVRRVISMPPARLASKVSKTRQTKPGPVKKKANEKQD